MIMRNIPTATYRVQLNKKFTFFDLVEQIDYLAELGISHVYLSPCLQATAGSMHGYDVVDHNRINIDLGGQHGFAKLCEKLEEKSLGIILDIVPNHMAISGPENPWWWDVLENGPASQYSRYFDVDWHTESDHRSNLILLPILGDHYGIVLDNGELTLKHDEGKFTLSYFENIFPLAPRSVSIILQHAYEKSSNKKLGFLAGALKNLPFAGARDLERIKARQRDKAVLFDLLQNLVCESHAISSQINEAIHEINADHDKLDLLVGQQNYKLAYWKLSRYQVGYRRFFNINSLVGLRMEDEQAFNDSHRLVIKLAEEGKISGFRVDHPDGLYDPTAYFSRLRNFCPDSLILAEKILEHHEELNPKWNISGTTGYDFLNVANGLFVNETGFARLIDFWKEISGVKEDFAELVYKSKKRIIKDLLGSEFNRLASDLVQICENHRSYRDFATEQLLQAVQEVAAHLTIYRTYIQPETESISSFEKKEIEQAIENAKEKRQDLGDYIFTFIQNILLLDLRGKKEDNFVRRFQQVTGPVMAKSLEDTVFYIYNPLTSVNEVGGNPQKPFTSVKEFHDYCQKIARYWPLTMLASSTHDTKRCEDIRARLNVLSDMPTKWMAQVKKWLKANKKYKSSKNPDANTEYLLYQTLVGAWPISVERIKSYMLKAVREAKVQTSWFAPDEQFEKALAEFIEKLYADESFITSLKSMVKLIWLPGRLNSLCQLTLKLTAPGFPDVYQGNEVWDNSLTDPDNRRPLDFEKNSQLLSTLSGKNCREIMSDLGKSLPKLYLIKKILKLRQNYPAFNEPDSYKPIDVFGSSSENLVAFMRGNNIIVLVPRLLVGLNKGWGVTRIIFPDGDWQNVFTDEIVDSKTVKIKDILRDFPVAVFKRKLEKEE